MCIYICAYIYIRVSKNIYNQRAGLKLDFRQPCAQAASTYFRYLIPPARYPGSGYLRAGVTSSFYTTMIKYFDIRLAASAFVLRLALQGDQK